MQPMSRTSTLKHRKRRKDLEGEAAAGGSSSSSSASREDSDLADREVTFTSNIKSVLLNEKCLIRIALITGMCSVCTLMIMFIFGVYVFVALNLSFLIQTGNFESYVRRTIKTNPELLYMATATLQRLKFKVQPRFVEVSTDTVGDTNRIIFDMTDDMEFHRVYTMMQTYGFPQDKQAQLVVDLGMSRSTVRVLIRGRNGYTRNLHGGGPIGNPTFTLRGCTTCNVK